VFVLKQSDEYDEFISRYLFTNHQNVDLQANHMALVLLGALGGAALGGLGGLAIGGLTGAALGGLAGGAVGGLVGATYQYPRYYPVYIPYLRPYYPYPQFYVYPRPVYYRFPPLGYW